MEKNETYYAEKNVEYATICTASLSFLDSYFNTYLQNYKEFITYAKNDTVPKVSDISKLRKINRFTKNKITRLNNLESQFLAIQKKLKKEFDYAFQHDEKVQEMLLDSLDEFWKQNVSIKNSELRVIPIEEQVEKKNIDKAYRINSKRMIGLAQKIINEHNKKQYGNIKQGDRKS